MAVAVHQFRLGPLRNNCYLVWDEVSRTGVIVDPPLPTPEIVEAVRKRRLTIPWVLITHGHFDHVIGVRFLLDELGAKAAMNPEDRPFLDEPSSHRAARFGLALETFEFTPLTEGRGFALGETEMLTIHTPGHTPGGVCFSLPQAKLLFTGDTLFHRTVGRTDLPGGDTAAIERSIREKLYTLPDDTRVFPGHGRPTTIGQEKRENPYVKAVSVS